MKYSELLTMKILIKTCGAVTKMECTKLYELKKL